MDTGTGLPATIPGTRGSLVLEWAERADSGPFSSFGIIDRLVYTNYEPFVTLTAAAAVTERGRLTTTLLIGPFEGRLTLGFGVGGQGGRLPGRSRSLPRQGSQLRGATGSHKARLVRRAGG